MCHAVRNIRLPAIHKKSASEKGAMHSLQGDCCTMTRSSTSKMSWCFIQVMGPLQALGLVALPVLLRSASSPAFSLSPPLPCILPLPSSPYPFHSPTSVHRLTLLPVYCYSQYIGLVHFPKNRLLVQTIIFYIKLN